MPKNCKCKLIESTLLCCISSICSISCVAFPVFSMCPSINPSLQAAYNATIGTTCSTLVNQLVGLLNKLDYENDEEPNQTEQPRMRNLFPTYQEAIDLPSYEEAMTGLQNNSSGNLIVSNISVIPQLHTQEPVSDLGT